MKKFRKPAIVLLVLLTLALAAGAAYRWRNKETTAEAALAEVRQGEFLVVVRCRGELRARKSVQMIAPANVPDLRIVWMAPSGSQISQGEPVIRFDLSAARRQLQEKQTVLEQAQAKVDEAVAQARITAAKDRRDKSEATYNVERARLEASKQDIVSAVQGENARIDLGLAESKLATQDAMIAHHETSEAAKIAALERGRDQAKYEVDLTNYRLSQMELSAPGAGVIIYSTNNSNITNYMNRLPYKVGDQVYPGTMLAEIPDLTTLEVEAKLDEIDRGRIRRGDTVRVRIDALPELTLPGQVMEISALTQLNMEWPMVSTFRAFAALDQSDPRLRPGMNATVDVIIQRIADAISVPAKALFTYDGKPVVFVSEGGDYRMVEVEVLARNPDEVAVKGLGEGVMVSLRDPTSEGEAP